MHSCKHSSALDHKMNALLLVIYQKSFATYDTHQTQGYLNAVRCHTEYRSCFIVFNKFQAPQQVLQPHRTGATQEQMR